MAEDKAVGDVVGGYAAFAAEVKLILRERAVVRCLAGAIVWGVVEGLRPGLASSELQALG
jgi:hypothetical protein